MRIRRRYAVILALVGAGALAVAGIALASATSSFSFKFSPSTVPKTTFKGGSLFTDLETHYTNPGNGNPDGAVERTQIYLDKNFKVDPSQAAKCSSSSLSGQTMAGAMAACSHALVGKGVAQAINPTTSGTVYGCVLLFNGKPTSTGLPTLQVFTRVRLPSGTIDCSNPSTNTQGQATVLLQGVLKPASGLYGKVLDVNHITQAAALPLTVYKTTIKKGKYISARCAASDKTWHMKTTWTYNKVGTQGGDSATVSKTQKCSVG
jgi:hypothetical protein